MTMLRRAINMVYAALLHTQIWYMLPYCILKLMDVFSYGITFS